METFSQNNLNDETINILIFEVNGTLAGIDAEQVAGIADEESVDKKAGKIISLAVEPSEEMPSFPEFNRKVLKIRNGDDDCSVLVGMPREILTLPITSVKPLPDLFKMYNDSVPVWGVVVQDDNIILLIDILKYLSIHCDLILRRG